MKYICGYCKSQESKFLYQTNDIFENKFKILRCLDCKAYFLAPKPTSEELDKAYDSSYYGENDEKFSSNKIENILDVFRQHRAKKISKYLQVGDKVLDIGCGNGNFLKYLLLYGEFELFGTELDGNSASRAERIKEINLNIGSIESISFPTNYFSAITMFHVFEHLSEPLKVLDKIDDILKTGGVLILSFPNISSLQSKIFKGRWLHLDPPRHLFFFEPKDFVKMMNKRGYELIKTNYISPEQNPFGAIQSMLNLIYKKRELLFEHLKGNLQYSQKYSKLNLFLQKMFFVFSFPIFVVIDVFVGLIKKGASVEFSFRKS